MALQFNYAMAVDNANLDDIPLAQPPQGVYSDFVKNPGSQTGLMLGLASAFMAIMLIVVGLRFYTKWRLIRAWSWDDITLMAGFLGTSGVFVLTCLFGVVSKVGSHVWNVPLGLVYSATWTSQNDCFDTLVPLTMGFVKITFFIYLYNSFHSSRPVRLVTFTGMILTTLFYLAIVIAQLTLWVPRPGQPLPVINPTGVSLMMNIAMFTMACGGVILDLAIWSLPLLALSRLETSGCKKCGIGCIFFVGLVAIVASCISVVYRVQSNMNWENDFMFYGMPTLLCTFIELAAGCTAASLPHLVVFYKHFNHNSRLQRPDSTMGSKAFPLANTPESLFVTAPDRARQQHLHRKTSTLSDSIVTISEHMAHPFSKLGGLSRKSSITALPKLEQGQAVPEMDMDTDMEMQRPRHAKSDDVLAQNASALAALDEQAQQLSARSFDNFRSRDIDPCERWEALKNWPPKPVEMGGGEGKLTNRYAFGD